MTRRLIRRPAILLAALPVVLVPALAAGARGAQRTQRAQRAHAAQVKTTPLLPLARGQLTVSLGTTPQWLPVSGRKLTLTLFSGRPRGAGSHTAAFISLQSAGKSCSATPGKSRPLYEIPDYYSTGHLLSRQRSPFAPAGGAAAGDYQGAVNGVTVRQQGSVRACVWLTSNPRAGGRDLAASQTLPLLNSTFAASVANLPQASGSRSVGGAGGYTMSAFDGGSSFSFTARTTSCGTSTSDSGASGAGDFATETVSLNPSPCPGDATRFSFRTGRRSLGTVTYTAAQAGAQPLAVAHLGACELDAVDAVPLSDAEQYVIADGCRVRHLEVSPYSGGLPRGTVLEATVDGGVADIAPRGTAVDLVLNGKP